MDRNRVLRRRSRRHPWLGGGKIGSRRLVHDDGAQRPQSLLREALSLSDDERADVIAALLVSLEDPFVDDVAAVEQAWAKELETRVRRVPAGQGQGKEWSQVRADLGRALTEG